MHGQEIQIGPHKGEQAVQFAETFVGHAPGELREPVVDRRKDPHHRGPVDHVMEVTDDEVGVGDVNIDRHRGQHDAGDASKDKVEEAPQAKQHRGRQA